MAESSFNLRSLLPQRGPLEGFRDAASDPAAFSAAFIWGIIFFGVTVFVWVLCQWGLVWWRTRQFLKLLDGVNADNAAEQRERLRQNGNALWQEFDASLVEDHDLESGRVWLRRSVDSAQIFNERSLARSLIHSRLISATSGLLTALGVLGAFIGLQQGISGLKIVNAQPGEMEESIQSLVGGLTIKFSSSIWGIFCSIVFNVLEKLVEGAAWSRIRHVQARIDALFSRYTPETSLSRLQISSAESEKILRGLAAQIGGHMQEALAKVGQTTSQAISDAMKPAVATLTDAAMKMTNDLSTGSAEGLSQGIESAAKSLEKSLNTVGDRYNQQFLDLSSQLRVAFEGLQSPVTQLSKDLGSQDTALTNAVERLEAHAGLAESFVDAAKMMQSAASELVSLKSSWETSAIRNKEAVLASEKVAFSNAQVATAFEKMPTQIEAASQGLKQAAESIKQTSSAAGHDYATAAEQQTRFVQSLANGLGQFADKIREALNIYGVDVQAQTHDRIQEFAKHTKVILDQLANLESELKGDLEIAEAVATKLRDERSN